MQFEDKFVEGTNMGPTARTDELIVGADRGALRAGCSKRLPMQMSRKILVAHRGRLFRVLQRWTSCLCQNARTLRSLLMRDRCLRHPEHPLRFAGHDGLTCDLARSWKIY